MHKEQTPRDLINGWNAQAIAAMALSFFGLHWVFVGEGGLP